MTQAVFPHPGRTRYWTEDRVLAGLQQFMHDHPDGPLPFHTPYSVAKKDHPEYPTAHRVTELHRTFPLAWRAAGARGRRLPWHNNGHRWTAEETEYLLEHVGNRSLALIGRHLLRTTDACKRHLYELGLRVRSANGYLNVGEVALQWNIPIHRVYTFVRDGRLRARKPIGVKNRWMIDPEDVDGCPGLLGPKLTHKTVPPQTRHHAGRRGYVTQPDGNRRRVVLP